MTQLQRAFVIAALRGPITPSYGTAGGEDERHLASFPNSWSLQQT